MLLSRIIHHWGNVVWTDLKLIQHAFNKLSSFFTISIMLHRLFKCPQHLVQQSVERMLNQMFKRALSDFRPGNFKMAESSNRSSPGTSQGYTWKESEVTHLLTIKKEETVAYSLEQVVVSMI